MENCLDFDGYGRKLKYGVPGILEYNVKENMLFHYFHTICSNPGMSNHSAVPMAKRKRVTTSALRRTTPSVRLARCSAQ